MVHSIWSLSGDWCCSFTGIFNRGYKQSCTMSEKIGQTDPHRQKWVISTCFCSFHTSPNHINHFIWTRSGSLGGGSTEFGPLERKKRPRAIEIVGFMALERGEICRDNNGFRPRTVDSRCCLPCPFRYDLLSAIDEKFRRFSTNAGQLAAVSMFSRGLRWNFSAGLPDANMWYRMANHPH